MILDENFIEEKEPIVLTDKEIFTRIWTEPRLVMKYVNDNSYDKFVVILLVIGGISNAFDRIVSSDLFINQPLIVLIGIGLVLAGLSGWLGNYIYSAILAWTGKAFNGKAHSSDIFRVSAYSMIPSLFSLLIVFLQLFVFGFEVFRDDFDSSYFSAGQIAIFFGSSLLVFVLAVWTLVIFVVGLSEVQKFSVGKAIGNLF
nr:YIP1 family protein [Cyclobacteriaceae bacterium]